MGTRDGVERVAECVYRLGVAPLSSGCRESEIVLMSAYQQFYVVR